MLLFRRDGRVTANIHIFSGLIIIILLSKIFFFLKFAAAQEICVTQGGNLASITTLAEQKFISDLVKRYQRLRFGFWIGLNDLDYEGVFKWVDGKPYQLANWNTRNPRENDSMFFFVFLFFLATIVTITSSKTFWIIHQKFL